jgi:hypothetical protein
MKTESGITWWRDHRFSDPDLERERQTILIGEANQEAGKRAVEEFRKSKSKL